MAALPADWLTLLGAVFALGAWHGLDADHLATIDGLARFNGRERPRLAPWCGTLFSLGHGAVVVGIALGVGALAPTWSVPAATEHVGAWISILFLVLLGALNIAAVVAAREDEVVAPIGVKGRLFTRLQRSSNPWFMASVGALFAVSFDTLSQAALFALAGAHFGGVGHALMLALSFLGGMLLVDGINGLWIARVFRRADRGARIASRAMGLAVGGLSLAVAALGVARYASLVPFG
jgi:high-affinity nickel-transport protein